MGIYTESVRASRLIIALAMFPESEGREERERNEEDRRRKKGTGEREVLQLGRREREESNRR